MKFVREVREELKGEVDGLVDMLEEVAKGTLALVSFTDPDARWGRKSKEMVIGTNVQSVL